MLNSHSSLGIAQIVFYTPIVPLVIYLLIRNGKKRPRMAWYPLILFSLMRLAGGIVTILAESKDSNIGLFVAALVLLNVGVVPLIIADLGFTRIILLDNFSHKPHADTLARIIRICFAAAAGLLGVGGGTASTNKSLSKILTLVGYIIFAAVLATLIILQIYFGSRSFAQLLPVSRKVLVGALCAGPFLALRTAYGILEVLHQGDANNTWSPILGSAIAFGLMALLPEYIFVCIWSYVGLTIPPDRGVPDPAAPHHAGVRLKDQTN